jgi:uncharacterized membrane protein YfhO
MAVLEASTDGTRMDAGSGLQRPDSAAGGRPQARIVEYAAGEILVTAELPAGGAVVVLESWHPGWTASVDGLPTAVYPADHAFLGVLVGPGQHEVRLRFAPLSLGLGVAVAGAVLVGGGLLGAILAGRRARTAIMERRAG